MSAWSAGKGAGQYELKRDDSRRRIVWHFAATANAARTFAVTYRAAGVVWQDENSDVLAWTLLPTRREYPIDCASGEIVYPEGAVLAAEAILDPPAARVSQDGRTIRFERCPVERDSTWVVSLRFAPRSVAAVAPRWQQRSIRNRENMPLFLGLGGLVLFAGVAGFVMFALRHRHPLTEQPGAVTAPPDDLRPALAASLTSTGASAGWAAVLGAVMDLARRGALSIESVEKPGLFSSKEVRISRGPRRPMPRLTSASCSTCSSPTSTGRRTSVDVLGARQARSLVATLEAAEARRLPPTSATSACSTPIGSARAAA